MRNRSILFCAALIALTITARPSVAQPQNQPQASADEQKLAEAISAAPDAAGKLKAGTDFIKKYPKSTLRRQVARSLAGQISTATDAAQKISLAQSYQQVFNEPSEQELIMPVMIDALSQAKRTDEAFSVGAAHLAKNPDSLAVLIQLIATGADEAKNKNAKFVPQSVQYGTHAIQLIEADKKPAVLDDAAWTAYKTDVLPSLYQSMGLLNLVTGNREQARASYARASVLVPGDPFNWVMLAGIVNEDYQNQAKRYQGTNGPAKEAELTKAQTMLDLTIDAYAHAIAVSEGNATLQQVRQQYMQDLEAYYKYRHNNSTEGMQQLIDKYKVAPKP